jgi:regulator of replication initiation timing
MNEDRSKEILNHITSMAREIGEFRADTKARFERLETEVCAGFADARKDVRRLHHKFEVVVEELTELKVESRDLRKRIEIIETKVGVTDDV